LQGGLRTDKLQRLLGTEPIDLPEALKRFRRHWRADTYVAHGPTRAGSEAGDLKQEILERVRVYHDLVHRPKPFVPYRSRVHYAGRVYGPEEMVNLVDAALDFWLTLGPYGDLFEARLRRLLGAKDVVLVNSGSSANLAAILTLMSRQFDRPLQPGDEILTVATTFPTTLAPIVVTGLTPVFVDVQLGTYNVDPTRLAEAVSERTRAIMLPHTLGNPFDLEAICALAHQHELLLIEDACDALGSEWQGRPVGTFGDLATLSFFPAHQITTGEGGAVVVNNPRLSRIARSVRDWGRDCWCAPGESNSCGQRFGWTLGDLPRGYDHKFTYTNIGFNFKPTDLQAAVGVAQLERLETFVEKRRRNFRLLYEGLRNREEWLILPRWDSRAAPAWFGFPLTTREGVSSTALIQHLENANIETRRIFAGNILKQPSYSRIPRRLHGSLDNTNRVMRDTFFIGVYPGLTDEMIGFVLEVFEQFFQRKR
jgi:CDP-6-deoxy-D-xylo-4-hexulose-3-dehydrase